MDKRRALENTIKLREGFRDIFKEALSNALTPDEKLFSQNEYNFIDNELKFLYNCLHELNELEEV